MNDWSAGGAEWDELNEVLEQKCGELERQVEIAKKLEEFRKTRSIAVAVDVCDALIKEMDKDD